uniref:Uncharacterized protein n=1 Tax=Tanacetum cinerariifolium TaxID=118510 RepID=A0A6L2KWR3_TANCI|nr:hypothetical protein [Tanacetum cinerariifolium]
MRGTTAQTRFKSVSKHSNDSLLIRGNTLQSDEDSLKLDELMALCTTLKNMVLDLEKTTTTQRNEIASLKRRVKKLEKINRSRTHRLKRLYKVGLTARVESSDGREVFVSKHEVAVKGVNDEVNIVEEVFEVSNTAKLIIDAAQDSVATTVSAATTTTATITTVHDITLAQALKEIKSTKPKEKGINIQELGKSTPTKSSQQSQDKGKGIMIERVIEPVKPMKRKYQIRFDEETALKLQAVFDEKERLAREKAEKLSLQRLLSGRSIKKGKNYYQIMRADGESQMYMVFSQMFKIFDREDLEDLYKLVKAKYESTRPVEDLDVLLWGNLKSMFEPNVEDEVWKMQQGYKVLNWKLYDSCGVHSLMMQSMQFYMLVEKKYPLTPLTLSMMLEKKLIDEYESEMAY